MYIFFYLGLQIHFDLSSLFSDLSFTGSSSFHDLMVFGIKLVYARDVLKYLQSFVPLAAANIFLLGNLLSSLEKIYPGFLVCLLL